jgi:prepilin-type processing-associated H-X9-DG protein
LNAAARNIQIFHCPSDKGDALVPQAPTCWDGFGNSYLVEWATDDFGVRQVTGSSTVTPIKGSDIARTPSTKIIHGDWMWHPNRPLNDRRSIWHNNQGQRLVNILYGDNHVAASKMPDTLAVNTPVDVNNDWW